jgi:predicted O-methyltransferase YrrM
MTFRNIYNLVGKHTMLSMEKAQYLYLFVLYSQPVRIFEMGCHRGGSALIMAAALAHLGRGKVLTYDLESARSLKPGINELARVAGLTNFVEPTFCHWCCEWAIADQLKRNLRHTQYQPFFDFAFFDGGHHWNATGYAFYLVTNLLRPGGWVLFDDLKWTIDERVDERERWVKQFPRDARSKPMVRMIFDLLVRPHPLFQNCHTTHNGDWGWAQRKPQELQVR